MSLWLALLPAQFAWGQSATTATAPATTTSTTTAPTGLPSNLNLSSTSKTIAAPVGGTVKVGTSSVTFKVGDLVTPAQALALTQLAGSGTQTLVLNSLGSAVGGKFSLTGGSASTIVIPKGVTGLGDFSALSTLNLSGNLANRGSLYLYSTDPASATAAINALNIYNYHGGIVSSVLPSTYGILGALPSLNLDLSAVHDIVNAGIIRSSGALNLTAGGSIINALPTGVTGALPSIQAATNLKMNANNIVNSGIIAALAGNLNIAAMNNNAIRINNTNGTLQALLGSINVRDALFSSKSNFDLTGGKLLSEQFNIFSGNGIANVVAKEISGMVNINAGEAHVSVEKGALNLGTMNLTGDPTFYNSGGAVNITQDLVFGSDLAIVANSDITIGPLVTTFDVSNGAGNGGAITLIAGANFTVTPGPDGSPVDTLPGDSANTLAITGASSTGGKIDLTGLTSLKTNSTNAGSNGGNVTMIAFAGSGTGAGTITLPTTAGFVFDTSGSGAGSNGNVLLIGGAGSGANTITVGNISTTGGTGGGGNVRLFAAAPVLTGVQINNGTVTAGTITPGTLTQGIVTVDANGTINAADRLSIATTGNIVSSGTLNAANGILLAATGTNADITAGDMSTTDGGSIALIASRNITLNNTSLASTTGESGAITFVAGATGTVNVAANLDTSVSLSGGTASGGKIALGTGSVLDTSSTIGNGGAINLIAFNGSSSLSGTISADSTIDGIKIDGAAGAVNGDLNIIAGATSGNAISLGGVVGGSSNTSSGGSINLFAAQPTFTPSPLVLTDGAITAGGFDDGTTTSGNIVFGTSRSISTETFNATTNGNFNLNGSSLSLDGTLTGGDGGSATINAGTVTLDGSITANGDTGFDGGSITINATGFTGTGTFTLNANGSDTGSGGSISVITTNPLDIGTAGGITQITANSGANSGSGGDIIVRSGGNLTVDNSLSALQASASVLGNGDGGNIELNAGKDTAAGNLFITGALNVDGSNNGSGGSLLLLSRSTTTFNVGASATTNGITGLLSAESGSGTGDGGSITIQNRGAGGLQINTDRLSVANQGTGNGGGIFLYAGSSAPSSLNGSQVQLDFTSNLPFKFDGFTSIPLAASGSITLSGATGLNASGNGDGNGGTIAIVGTSVTNSSGAAMNLSADGSGNGNGGIVDIGTTGTGSNITIDSSAGAFQIAAQGGATSGNGGNVNLRATNADITVNPSGLMVGPQAANGNGGNIQLAAGSPTGADSNVFVSGSIDVSGQGTGDGGTVFILTSSATPLTIAPGTTVNGVDGSITADGGSTSGNGGTVVLSNFRADVNGIGIDFSDPSQVSANPSTNGGNGGTLVLTNISPTNTSPSGSVKLLLPSSGTLSMNGSAAGGSGGTIVLQASDLTGFSTGNLGLEANGVNNGNGGQIVIATNGTVNLDTATGAGQITASAAGGATSGNGGSVYVNAGTVTAKATAVDISVNAANGDGGFLRLTSGASLTADGQFSALGAGSGTDGSIIFSSTNGAVLFGTLPGTSSIDSGNISLLSHDSFTISSPLTATKGLLLATTAINADITLNNASLTASNGASISIIGTRNVSSAGTAGNVNLSSASATSDAGQINVIAGASVSAPTFLSGGSVQIGVTGGTASGGDIDFAGTAIGSFDASSSAGNGGNVNLVAFASTNPDTASGHISLPTALTLSASGSAGNDNGGVNVFAGALSGSAISIGSIDAQGAGTAGGGNVNVISASPSIINGTSVTFKDGEITSGDFGSGALTAGSVSVDAIGSGGGINVVSGGGVAIGGNVNALAGVLIGSTASTSDVTLGGDVIGQNISILAGRDILSSATINLDASATTNAGQLNLIAGVIPTFEYQTSGSVKMSMTGGSATGGRIAIATTGSTLKAESTSGNGGTINLIAFKGTGTLSGTVSVASDDDSIFMDTADSSKTNGDLNIIAGATTGNAISLGGIVGGTLTGGSGGSINLLAAQPTFTPSPLVVTDGMITAGGFGNGATTAGNIVIAESAVTQQNVNTANFNATTNGTFDLNGTNLLVDANFSQGNGGSVTVNAGTVALGGFIGARGSGAGSFNGGNISINTTGFSGNGLFSLDVTGSGNGDGGNISVIAKNTFAVGTVGGITEILANSGGTGGSGGDIILRSGGNLTVDNSLGALQASASAIGNGDGGNVELNAGKDTAAGNLFITGGLNVDGSNNGSGGSLLLLSRSATKFNVGASATTNGVTGLLSAESGTGTGAGGTITIQNRGKGGLQVDTDRVSIENQGTGDGGGIFLYAATTAPSTLNASQIDLDLTRSLPFQFTANGFTTIPLTATGTITLTGTNGLDASAGGTGNGGQIAILGTTVTNSSGAGMGLRADGAGTGNGGLVDIGTTAANGNITVDGTTGNFSISAQTGIGTGGTVNLRAFDGSITVAPGELLVQPTIAGNGGTIQLAAGNNKSGADRNVFVSGGLDVSGVGTGSGGSVWIMANSSKTLGVGSGTVNNGVNGSILANATTSGDAGDIVLSNYRRNSSGVGVSIGNTIDTQNFTAAGAGNGGSFIVTNLSANNVAPSGAVSVSIPAGTIDRSGSLLGGGNGGNVVLQAADIIGFTGGALALVANGVDTGTGANGGNIVFSASSSSRVLSTGGGSGQLSASADADGAAGNGGGIFVSAGTLTVDTSDLSVSPAASGNGGLISLNGNKALNVNGDIDVGGAGTGIGGFISLTSKGALTFGTDPGGVLLNATGTPGGTIIVKGVPVNGIDASTNPLTVNAANITLDFGKNALAATYSTGGGGTISASSTGASVTLTSSDVGITHIGTSKSGGTFDITSQGGFILDGNVNATKSIAITSTATGDIKNGATPNVRLTAPTVTLSAADGDIGFYDESLDPPTDQRILTTASKLSLTAGGTDGDIFINNKGAVTLLQGTATGTFMVGNSSTMTVPLGVTIDSPDIYLRTEFKSNGSIILNGGVGTSTAPGTLVRIAADGRGSITQSKDAPDVQADTILFDYPQNVFDPLGPVSFGNIGSTSAPIRVTGNHLGTLSFGASTNVLSHGPIALDQFSDAEGTYNITAMGGDLRVDAPIATLNGSLHNSITLKTIADGITPAGDIIVGPSAGIGFSDTLDVVNFRAIIRPGSTVVLNSGKGIKNEQLIDGFGVHRGVVRGHNVTLIAANGDIGVDNLPNTMGFSQVKLSTSATNLFLNAPVGNAFLNIEDIDSLSFLPMTIKQANVKAGGDSTFSAFSFRPITVAAPVNADKVDLEIYATLVGDITVNANLGRTGVGSTQLSADGNNSIFMNTGTILSETVVLGGMTTGDIGTSSKPIKTQASTIIVGTVGADHLGNVYISNNSPTLDLKAGGTLLPTTPTASGGIFSVRNTGDIVVVAGQPILTTTAEGGLTGNVVDGVNKLFNYPWRATSSKQLEVYFNGVRQTSGFKFDLVNRIIAFTTAPAAGTDVKIVRAGTPTVSLTSTGGQLDISDDIMATKSAPQYGGSTINLKVSKANNIVTQDSSVFLIADTINLTAATGNIGSFGNAISVGGGTVKATTTGTSSQISLDAVTNEIITGAAAPGVTLTSNPGFVSTGGFDWTIGGVVGKTSGSTDISTDLAGSGSILQGTGGSILGNTISLNAPDAIGAPTARIKFTPGAIVTMGASEAYLQSTKAFNVGPSVTVSGTFDLQAAGNITGAVLPSVSTLSLIATSGTIGSATTPFGSSATDVTIQTPAAAFVDVDQGSVVLNNKVLDVSSSNPALNITVRSGSAMTVNSIAGNNVDLESNSTLTLATAINTSGNVTLKTNSSGNILQTSGTVSAASITINAKGGIGKSATVPFFVDSPALSINATGSAFIDNAQATSLDNAKVGSIFQLTNNGALATKSITATSKILLTANTGDITLGGASDTISAPTVNFQALNGNITQGGALKTSNVSAVAVGGDITLSNTATTVKLTKLQSTGTVDFTSTGNMTQVGTTTNVSGIQITLNSTGGSIGTSTTPLKTSGDVFDISTTGTNHNAFITNANTIDGNIDISSSNGIGGAFKFTDNSTKVTLNGPITTASNTPASLKQSTNDFTIIENGAGGIYLADNAVITVNGGSAILWANSPAPDINFGANSELTTNVAKTTSTSNGLITLVIGPKLPTTSGATIVPAGTFPGAPNVIVDMPIAPGNVLIAKGSNLSPIDGSVPIAPDEAHLNAEGRSILISTTGPSGIHLNDGVLIHADPPMGGATVVSTPTHVVAASNGTSISSVPRDDRARVASLPTPLQVGPSIANLVPSLPNIPQSAITARDTITPRVLTGGVATLNGAGERSSAPQQLQFGGTILAPDEDVIISTPFGELKVAAKAIVLAMLTDNGLALYNLHDEHRGDVELDAKSGGLGLDVGRHMFVTRSESAYESLNPLGYIGHRNLHSTAIADGVNVFTSDFSIPSAIGGNGPLSAMLRSGNADEKRIINRLLKDAAIIMQTKAADGLYKRLVPADVSWAHDSRNSD